MTSHILLFFLISFFTHSFQSILATLFIYLFIFWKNSFLCQGHCTSCPLWHQGWRMFIFDLQMFRLCYFRIQLQYNIAPLERSSLTTKSETSSHVFSIMFCFDFLHSIHHQSIFLPLFLLIYGSMHVCVYTYIQLFLRLSQMGWKMHKSRNYTYCLHSYIPGLQNTTKIFVV